MHGTQGSSSLIYGGAAAVYPKLLRAASVLELCLYCHGTSNPGAIDWAGRTPPQIANNIIGYVPSAGDFQSNNTINEANRHSIGLAVPTPPGNNDAAGWSAVTTKWGTTFMCLYCHDQHGNRNYRNLRYDPGNPSTDNLTSGVKVTYSNNGAGTCSDGAALPCDVNEATSASNLTKYYRTNVAFYKTSGKDYNRISEWCSKCHTKFYSESAPWSSGDNGPYYLGGSGPVAGVGLGDNNTGNPWYRHPVGDINIGAANLHTDTSSSAYITSGTIRTVDMDGTLANRQPFCLSCHYAHGGGNYGATQALNHSNLAIIDGSGNLNIQGAYDQSTGYFRNVCLQCHNQ
jgi:cytochrome c553